MERLREIGLTPTEICPSGVTALIEGAKPGKVLLLRADMDALPMPENNDLTFKTETDAAHRKDRFQLESVRFHGDAP